ncbi:tripartite motif-containing protein 59-like [Patiria miniata]|uniref:Uncharacterized protein n=1 Tax=Patiria miniata TaxID=46514 RepID=A0A914B4H8_PATMI|nr:tripartite motif-containing protein 59-like [Patiria miniata]
MAKKGVHGSSLWNFAEEHLTCSICYNLFDTPKTLACLHSFCENCLLQYHDGYSEELLCPVCRQADSTALGGVESLTTDFKLVNMVEAVRQEDKQTAPFCSEHAGKPCRAYCQTCEELLCLNCLAESDDHSEHVLEEVREVVDGKRQAVKDHMPQYQTFMKDIAVALNQTDTLEQDFDLALDKTRKEVQHKAEMEIAKVNAAKNILLDELQQIQSKRKERFAENKLELTGMRNTFQQIIDHSTDAMQEINDYDFMKRYQRLSNDFQYLSNSSLPSIDANASFLKFDPSTRSLDSLLFSSRCYRQRRAGCRTYRLFSRKEQVNVCPHAQFLVNNRVLNKYVPWASWGLLNLHL